MEQFALLNSLDEIMADLTSSRSRKAFVDTGSINALFLSVLVMNTMNIKVRK